MRVGDLAVVTEPVTHAWSVPESVGRHQEQRRASAVDFVSVEKNVTQGESARVVVRVRDQYGNALPGATVFANSSDVRDAGERRVTGDRGRAAFEFNTSRITGNANPQLGAAVNVTVNESVADELNSSSSSFDQRTSENATVNITVESVSVGLGPGPAPGPGNATVQWNRSAMDAAAGVNYFSSNRTLLVNRSRAGTEFTARANATNTSDGSPLSGAELDFVSNNASVIEFNATDSNDPGQTNDAGEFSLPAEVPVEGTTTISAFGVGTSDELTVKTVGSSSAPRPSGRAFNDADGDGVYDAGETTYTAAELENGFDNSSVNLVIPSDVGPLNSGENQLQISANSITSRVDIDTSGGKLNLTASGGDIDISGGNRVSSGESQMELTASSGAIRFNGSTLDSDEAQIQLTSEGIYGTNAAVRSRGSKIQMDGEASNVVLTDTLVNSDGGEVNISTDAVLRITNATVKSGESKASLSGGDVFGDDVTVNTDESALTITATEGGDIRTRGGAFRTNGGQFKMITKSGDVCLNPSSTRSSEIKASGGEAIISTANTSYLHDLFVSASKSGLQYGGSGRGDYYGTVYSSGNGLRDGNGEGNDNWDQIDSSRTDCGF